MNAIYLGYSIGLGKQVPVTRIVWAPSSDEKITQEICTNELFSWGVFVLHASKVNSIKSVFLILHPSQNLPLNFDMYVYNEQV